MRILPHTFLLVPRTATSEPMLVYEVMPKLGEPWLVFQTLAAEPVTVAGESSRWARGRRRLRPFPAEWKDMSARELVALADRAEAAAFPSDESLGRLARRQTRRAIESPRVTSPVGLSTLEPRRFDHHREQLAIMHEQMTSLASLVAALRSENQTLREELALTRDELRQMNAEHQDLVATRRSTRRSPS